MHYGSAMSTITLKNVPPELHEAIRGRAKVHGRSLNREILATLEAAVGATRIDAAALTERARSVRDSMGIYLTENDLDAAKRGGRG